MERTPVMTALRRLRVPLATITVLATLTATLTACALTSTGGASTPTAANPPVATACAQVPGFDAAKLVNIANTEFPKDTVVIAQTSAGGPGRFTVKEYNG